LRLARRRGNSGGGRGVSLLFKWKWWNGGRFFEKLGFSCLSQLCLRLQTRDRKIYNSHYCYILDNARFFYFPSSYPNMKRNVRGFPLTNAKGSIRFHSVPFHLLLLRGVYILVGKGEGAGPHLSSCHSRSFLTGTGWLAFPVSPPASWKLR